MLLEGAGGWWEAGDKIDERVAAAAVLAKSLAKEQGIEFEKGAAEDLADLSTT